MASEKEVKEKTDEIMKLVEKAGGWVEEIKTLVKSGKISMVELKISFKVT